MCKRKYAIIISSVWGSSLAYLTVLDIIAHTILREEYNYKVPKYVDFLWHIQGFLLRVSRQIHP
jgi:hypothetical protein